MSVFRLVPASNEFDCIHPVEHEDYDLLPKFNGRPLASQWRSIPVRIERRNRRSDFPSLAGNVPVFSERAWGALRTIAGNVEALPLVISGDDPGAGAPLYAINVLSVVDCLDYSRASVVRLSSGRVMTVKRYAFVTERLGDTALFKIPETALSEVLATERFRESVEQHGLVGLSFRAVF